MTPLLKSEVPDVQLGVEGTSLPAPRTMESRAELELPHLHAEAEISPPPHLDVIEAAAFWAEVLKPLDFCGKVAPPSPSPLWLDVPSWDARAPILGCVPPPPQRKPEICRTMFGARPAPPLAARNVVLRGTWASPTDLRVESATDAAVRVRVWLDGRGGIVRADGRVGPRRARLVCDVPRPEVGRVVCTANPDFGMVFRMYTPPRRVRGPYVPADVCV